MLTLTRKPGEAIAIGDDVVIEVVHIRGTQVRLIIRAPDDVLILRSELSSGAAVAKPAGRPDQDS